MHSHSSCSSSTPCFHENERVNCVVSAQWGNRIALGITWYGMIHISIALHISILALPRSLGNINCNALRRAKSRNIFKYNFCDVEHFIMRRFLGIELDEKCISVSRRVHVYSLIILKTMWPKPEAHNFTELSSFRSNLARKVRCYGSLILHSRRANWHKEAVEHVFSMLIIITEIEIRPCVKIAVPFRWCFSFPLHFALHSTFTLEPELHPLPPECIEVRYKEVCI